MIKTDTIIAGRYTIVRLLGKGGMGNVYEAKHTDIGKRVAIKILNKEYSEQNEALERFQQEAKIAGTIGHRNICEVLDFGKTEEGLPFLVMEYLEGESLADILDHQNFVPMPAALAIVRQILDALEEVHGRGIIHRDLKPENIIITREKGYGMVVKLLDFGISKVIQVHSDSLRLTKTGTMLGTPYYMSPEQVRGKRTIDYSTDLYSCGVILYEMILGRRPFEGTSYNDVILSIVEDTAPDPKKLAPGLPNEVVKMLKRSMEKDPSKRFESAAEFKKELDGLPIDIGDGRNMEISATKMSSMTGIQTARQARRSSLKIGVIIGMAILLAGIVAGGLYLGRSGRSGGKGDGIRTPSAKTAENPNAPASPSPVKKPPVEEPEKIRIKLNHLPEGARLKIGDEIVEDLKENTLEVKKSSKAVTLTLSAHGFKEKKIDITPSEDLTLDAALEPAETSKAQKEEGEPVKDELPAKSKKKKMKPIWKY